MKKCVRCGKVCDDNDSFCSSCGASEFESVDQSAQQSQQTYENTNAQQQNGYFDPNNNREQGAYYNPNDFIPNTDNNYQKPVNDEKKCIDDAKICGIVSLAIILIGLVDLSWIPALIGKNKLKNVFNLRDSSEYNTARLLNNIGMILSIIAIVITVLVFIAQIIFVAAGVGFGLDIFGDVLSDFGQMAMIYMLF